METKVIKASETKIGVRSLNDVKEFWISKGVKAIEEYWSRFNSNDPILLSVSAKHNDVSYSASLQFGTNNIILYKNGNIEMIVDVNA